MKFINLFLLIALFFISSCSEDDNKITFSSSVDEKYGWTNGLNTIVSAPSHSGTICSKIDSLNPYSFGFYYEVKQLFINPIKKAKFSAWVKLDKLPTNIALVGTITSNQNKIKHQWVGINTNDIIKQTNEWTLVKGEIIFPDNLPADAQIWFYAWSPNGQIAYVDDLEISFE